MDMHSISNRKKLPVHTSQIIMHSILIILMLKLTQNVPCNSFPKILGGNGGDAYLYQLDVYGDYVALGGKTNDNTLTGSTSSIPYVAVMSVSTGGYFYWAKGLPSKPSQEIAGLQFSTDGVLLIAHSGLLSPAFIVVFNSATGAVVSSRGYSSGSYDNYDNRTKSLLVSAGSAPMAYVLTKFQTSTLCSSQHFFKFDPLVFSTSPVWAKKTLVSGTALYCMHLGITFGRNENFIYAFSWYNSLSTISLLDINGAAIWQYSTPYGDLFSNLIQYKAVDAATDVVIGTSGYDYVNFNRIISSSSSPYSVQQATQYYDPNPDIYREIRALYIVSLTSAKAIIFDFTNLWTDLASLDFSTSPAKITYKKTMPYMHIGGMITGVFKSDTIYYVGTYSNRFYQSLSTSYQTLNTIWYQSIVYSSDMTQSTCYSLSTAAAQTPISMGTLSLTAITSGSIYTANTLTFVADTAASTTVDIVQSTITKMSWCVQSAFTVNSVTQAQTTFSFNTNVAVQNLGITPYSATVNCGSLINTWTYSGIMQSTGLALVPASDLISVDANFGTIQVQMTKPAGIYNIKVVGTLPDLKTTHSYVFTINIGSGGNQAPYFNSPLPDVSVPLMTSYPYSFPAITDPDAGDTVSITTIKESITGSVPSFISVGNPLTINPTFMSDVNVYTMIVIISDNHAATSQYQFIITVTNQAPKVTTAIPTSVQLTFGQDLMYNLPTSIDPEGLPYTTSIMSGPSYASIPALSNTQVRLFPSNCKTDVGDFNLVIQLTDQEPKSFSYSITLSVPNQPPAFTGSLPQNQTMMYNTIFTYTLPSFQDPEGCTVVLTYLPTTLSSFVSVSGNQIVFSPKQLFQVGDFSITVILTDYQGLSTNATFGMFIYQPPQFVGSVTKQLDLMASNVAYYSLPVMPGMADEYVVHDLSLPRFATFSFPDYTFLPIRKSDLGVYTIKGQFWNAYTSISFQFRVNVTNEAPYLMGAQLPDQIVVALNTIETYLLPSAVDREGQTLTYLNYELKKTMLPQFMRFNISSKEFTIAPTILDIVDKYTIQLDIKDPMDAVSSYSFVVSLYDPSLFLPTQQNNTNTNTSKIQVNTPVIIANKTVQNTVQIVVLKLLIVKASRESEVTVRISGENGGIGLSELIKKINNQSFDISITQKNTTFKIAYSIISKDTTNFQLKIKVKYPNPSNISITPQVSDLIANLKQIPDKLTIINVRRMQMMQQKPKKLQIVMMENTEAKADVPPQLTEGIKNLEFHQMQNRCGTESGVFTIRRQIDIL